jgi:hypothetical protein
MHPLSYSKPNDCKEEFDYKEELGVVMLSLYVTASKCTSQFEKNDRSYQVSSFPLLVKSSQSSLVVVEYHHHRMVPRLDQKDLSTEPGMNE